MARIADDVPPSALRRLAERAAAIVAQAWPESVAWGANDRWRLAAMHLAVRDILEMTSGDRNRQAAIDGSAAEGGVS